MTTHIITINPSMLVDLEGAYIPYSENPVQAHQPAQIRRSGTPFSEMKTGKFRKLFDRHKIMYR